MGDVVMRLSAEDAGAARAYLDVVSAQKKAEDGAAAFARESKKAAAEAKKEMGGLWDEITKGATGMSLTAGAAFGALAAGLGTAAAAAVNHWQIVEQNIKTILGEVRQGLDEMESASARIGRGSMADEDKRSLAQSPALYGMSPKGRIDLYSAAKGDREIIEAAGKQAQLGIPESDVAGQAQTMLRLRKVTGKTFTADQLGDIARNFSTSGYALDDEMMGAANSMVGLGLTPEAALSTLCWPPQRKVSVRGVWSGLRKSPTT